MRILLCFLALVSPALAQGPDEDAPEGGPAVPASEAPASVEAAPATEPAIAEPAIAEPAVTIAIKRHLVGTGIEGNEPVGVAESFSAAAAPRLSCFMELVNPTKGELKIQTKWYRGDKLMFTQPMRLLPGPSTRTWAHLKIDAKRTGTWRCEVEDEAGAPISKLAFTVAE